jgi:hypothetical protein
LRGIVQAALSTRIYTFISVPVDRGTFGDVFGGINTLFSGLAFAGVMVPLFCNAKSYCFNESNLN